MTKLAVFAVAVLALRATTLKPDQEDDNLMHNTAKTKQRWEYGSLIMHGGSTNNGAETGSGGIHGSLMAGDGMIVLIWRCSDPDRSPAKGRSASDARSVTRLKVVALDGAITSSNANLTADEKRWVCLVCC
ncbi:hypothetical protein AKJ16_DCAP24151 [Drosera capensis]